MFVLAFSFAFVTDLRLVPAMLAVSFGLCALSRLPAAFLWKRLRYPGIFILFLAVMLPLFSGEQVLFSVGFLSVREEGVLAFLLIAGRFVSIVLVGLLIFGTATVNANIRAMRALGLPPILADMTLFTYRYLDELGETLTKMRRATRLRGFTENRTKSTLTTFAALTGSLLVRSHERSERVYSAMVMRGYGLENRRPDDFRATTGDLAALGLVLLVAAGFVVGQVVIR